MVSTLVSSLWLRQQITNGLRHIKILNGKDLVGRSPTLCEWLGIMTMYVFVPLVLEAEYEYRLFLSG